MYTLFNNLYFTINMVMKAKFRKLRSIGDVARVGREIIHSKCWRADLLENSYLGGRVRARG